MTPCIHHRADVARLRSRARTRAPQVVDALRDLAAAERVQPGFAERIMRLREKELDHQISMERGRLELRQRVADAEIRSFTRAQWFTFVFVVVFLVLAGVSLFLGQQLSAITGGLGVLATIACVLRGHRTVQREVDVADGATDGGDTGG